MYSHRYSRSQRILQNFVLSLSRCSSNASDNITIHASMIVRFPLVFSSLLAQLCKPSLSAALLLPSLDNSQLPVCDLTKSTSMDLCTITCATPAAPTYKYAFSSPLRNVFSYPYPCASHQPAAFCKFSNNLLVSINAL